MEEDMGIIFVNGKMYNLNELTQEQLRDLDRILEETNAISKREMKAHKE